MGDTANFFDESGDLRIEVEGPVNTSSGFSGQLANAVQAVSSVIAEQINQAEKEKKPTEVQISFGLKAMGDGGFAIGMGDGAANFRVTIKFGGQIPALSSPQDANQNGDGEESDEEDFEENLPDDFSDEDFEDIS